MSPASEAPPETASAVDRPLSELAYQAMMGMLTRGELEPNEVVTERQIASRLGISRTPLREAIRRLEGERLLARQRGGALVVRPLPVDEYLSILDVRILLEGEAARLAAGRIPAVVLERMRASVEALRALPEQAPVPAAFADSDRDLHLLIARASGNPVLLHMVEDLRTRTAMVRFGRQPMSRGQVCDEHLAILDALARVDGAAARDAMQNHVGRVRAVILAGLGVR